MCVFVSMFILVSSCNYVKNVDKFSKNDLIYVIMFNVIQYAKNIKCGLCGKTFDFSY